MGERGGVYSAEKTVSGGLSSSEAQTGCHAEELGAFRYPGVTNRAEDAARQRLNGGDLTCQVTIVDSLGVLLYCCVSSKAICYEVYLRYSASSKEGGFEGVKTR